MHHNKSRHTLLVLLLFMLPFIGKAEQKQEGKEEKFDVMGNIMHHIGDMHSFPIISYMKEGKEVKIEIPLPIILVSNGEWHIFSSSEFHHGKSIVNKGNHYFVLYHEKIYETDSKGQLEFDSKNHPLNKRPLDFSITRNVVSMWISVILLLSIFVVVARRYKNVLVKPKGLQSFMEPLILFVRDNIAYEQIRKDKADKYIPYLLTVFFFIWINNLIGLIPFFPGASNLTGNISFTLVLATITFLITAFSGNKGYWHHMVAPPGIPFWVNIILAPIEIVSMFTKPFALMVRLFANITAGHIIILSMSSLIFIFGSLWVSLPVSFLLQIIMSLLELLVGFLQAFIFTLLSALFIGLAMPEETH